MQERTQTLTVDVVAAYAAWSDARLLHAALQELPFSVRAEVDEALDKRKLNPIGLLTPADVEVQVDAIWDTLVQATALSSRTLQQRLYDEVCVKADYCRNRDQQDWGFWSDVIAVVASILGDLGFIALSLLVLRRMLDHLCGCAGT